MALDTKLVSLLVCPVCKGRLAPCPDEDGLACDACQVVYPVKDGIPVMLTDEAISKDQWHGSK